MAIKKKHTSGAAKNFITRTQAVKKLQVSLADFRRLCIFKGIYPREPRNKKKANKGSTAPTTFYYAKDIQYLLHEPILQKFRDHKAFAKKLSRALGRGEVGDAKRLDDNRPRYQLNHVIKERYPTFLDALRDLDDPLSMLFLFAVLPASDSVNHEVTAEADKLCGQWMAYVAREKALTKVFVSIKGVYYQAVIKGQPILWLVPFKFTQNVPTDVDFRIMGTFLEFYSTLVKFVLYRLYSEAGLVYPPPIDPSRAKGVGGITSFILKSLDESSENQLTATAVPAPAPTADTDKVANLSDKNLKKAIAADKVEGDQEAEEDDGEEDRDKALDAFSAIPATDEAPSDVLAQPKEADSAIGSLFSKFVFFVGREVSIDIVEVPLVAGGAKVITEASIDELVSNDDGDALSKIDLSAVTHQIIDRPAISRRMPKRIYVQPQWVFDCINASKLLPVGDYAPGETLPPHLSPWGDAGGYDPEDKGDDDGEDEDEDEIEVADEDVDQDEDEENEDDEALKELEQEAAGVSFSQAGKPKKSTKRSAEDEEKELKKMMMTNKQRKLYEKMQYGLNKKKTREEELRKKRRKIDETKQKLGKK